MDALITETILLLLGAFLIGCILGCWLKSLFSADETMPSRAAAPAASVATASVAASTPSGAFEWTAKRSTDAVILDGMVPTIGDRNAIVEDAKVRFAKLSVDDRMTIGGKVPAGADWLDSARFALRQLEGVASGDASLKGASYSLRGVAATKKAYDSIRKALPDALPAGLALGTLSLDTPAAKAPAKPKAKVVAKPVSATPEAGEVIAVESDRELSGSQPKGLRAAKGGAADDLKRIKGIGKVNEGKLNSFGIWHFDQIAAWTAEEIDWVDDYLAFPGRIEREDWVDQARVLAEGGETKFSKRVDAGDVETSAGGPSKKPG
jgi:branched-chain amino acid transport system ATP-binding protein